MQGDVKGGQQGDAQVYQELARANLLRMRGDYLGAEAECLKILRRFPNNASAHTLLGDIYAEKGDPEQALQWYELSADLVADGAVTEKIASTQRRISDREQATTAKELGLPAERSQKAKFVFSILIPVIVVFIAAYALGRREGQVTHAAKSSKIVPISAPGKEGIGEEGKDSTDKNIENPSVGSDLVLLGRIKSNIADGASLLMVLQDPRTKDLTLAYLVEEDKQIRPTGARMATAALEAVPDALLVTVRAMRGANLVYIANVHRAHLNETKQTSWQTDNRDNPSAWIDYVLENEWSSIPKSRALQGEGSQSEPGQSPDQPATTSDPKAPAPSGDAPSGASPAPVEKNPDGATAIPPVTNPKTSAAPNGQSPVEPGKASGG